MPHFSSDMWSTMCVLVEMLTGQKPWKRFDSNLNCLIFKVWRGRGRRGNVFHCTHFRLAIMKMSRWKQTCYLPMLDLTRIWLIWWDWYSTPTAKTELQQHSCCNIHSSLVVSCTTVRAIKDALTQQSIMYFGPSVWEELYEQLIFIF